MPQQKSIATEGTAFTEIIAKTIMKDLGNE